MKVCNILQHWRRFLLLCPVVAGLTGCGAGNLISGDGPTSGSFAIAGVVHGGNQPVTGSTIQLYTAGNSGNGSTATAMITSTTVTTGTNGSFTISGDYTCVHSTDQVYLTATGGNPGLASGTNNNALVMLVAIGNCGNLTNNPTQFLLVNEVTTAAAVYALAPFISTSTTAPYFNIGASSTNSTGLANAFLNAQLLANIATGAATTLPSVLTTQPAKLYALADAISYCVNSLSSASSACSSLVTAATPNGGSAPAATTIATALSIARHPGDSHIVPAVWSLINTQAPFPTTPLTQAPSDWSMTLTISNGGLSEPIALGVDKSGNVWVANYGTSANNSTISAFSPQGTAFNNSPFGGGTLDQTFGLTIDTSGNIWVTNYQAPNGSGSVSKFLGANSGTPGSIVPHNSTNYFTDASIDFPNALTADLNGNIGIANQANSSATVYNAASNTWTGGLGSGSASTPLAIAFDSSHGLWLANYGNSTVTHVSSGGTILSSTSLPSSGADGIAVDSAGNAWIANYSGQYVYAVNSSGSGIANTTGGGLSTTNSQPVGVAVDAAQNIWIADGNGAVITELTDTGFAVSPSTGYGVDAKLGAPKGIALDASGNVWTSDYSKNAVVMFFGIATPTVTPVQPVPSAP